MDPSNSLVIETHNLSKTYKGVQALKDLNLTVPQHSIFGFLGPNGAGKTTTMKILLGLIRPSSGGGKIFGHDIVRDSVAIRERIGYLQQQPRFTNYMTARETLRFAAGFFYQRAEGCYRSAHPGDPGAGWAGGQGRPPGQGFFRRGTAAPGHRPGPGQLPRPAHPGRTGGRAGSARPACRARGDGAAAQTHHDLLFHPHPGRCAAGQRYGGHFEPRPAGRKWADRPDDERQGRHGFHHDSERSDRARSKNACGS